MIYINTFVLHIYYFTCTQQLAYIGIAMFAPATALEAGLFAY